MNSTINQLKKRIHDNAIVKGFHDEPLEVGTLLMLVVSELGEALEAHRTGQRANLKQFEELLFSKVEFKTAFEIAIKNSFEDELADVIIRMLDVCAVHNIDINKHIELKHKYNTTRPRKHGKRY